jgi:hypothetical protein
METDFSSLAVPGAFGGPVRHVSTIHSWMPSVLAGIVCLACASNTPGPDTTINTRTLSSPGNRVIETTDVTAEDQVRVKGSTMEAMTALTQIYGELQIPIATMIPDAGQIGNQHLRMATHRLNHHLLSFYLNCGQESMVGSRADLDEITLSVLSTVRTTRDSVTEVGTLVQGMARPTGTSSNPVDCQSTGELEKAMAARLQAELGAPVAHAAS